MARRTLLWHIFTPYLLILLAALLAVSWSVTENLRRSLTEQAIADLTARAELIRPQLTPLLQQGKGPRINTLCNELGHRTGTRLTVITGKGLVVGDSEHDPDTMENHAGRPEIVQALSGKTGVAMRYSTTLQQTMLYVALPLQSEQTTIGVIRASFSASALEATVGGAIRNLAGGSLAVALCAGLAAWLVSRRISRPLALLQQGAQRFADGDLSHPLPEQGSAEICDLAAAMNGMAAQLDERLRTVLRQRNEQNAILASMVEGVIAFDTEERLLRLNRAAAQLLEIDFKGAAGRALSEVTRKTDVQKFVRRALGENEPIEAELTLLHHGREFTLQGHGSPLRDARGNGIGALIVLHDVTRLRKLETMRRDFVANVSHELKTPITAIKGAIETLRDGAAQDPEHSARFLDIATRQADRLGSIIEDLLSLSRLERDAETEEIRLEKQPLKPVLEDAVQDCSAAAAERQVQLKLSCSQLITARLNAGMLEQAISNLLDNAIKYSPEKSTVSIEAWQEDDQVRIKVQDRGCGIAAEHLPRLFERFYRVDAARSRSLGGTGLGLAIVKHIVQSHGGKVSAHSTPGQGSAFIITLPTH